MMDFIPLTEVNVLLAVAYLGLAFYMIWVVGTVVQYWRLRRQYAQDQRHATEIVRHAITKQRAGEPALAMYLWKQFKALGVPLSEVDIAEEARQYAQVPEYKPMGFVHAHQVRALTGKAKDLTFIWEPGTGKGMNYSALEKRIMEPEPTIVVHTPGDYAALERRMKAHQLNPHRVSPEDRFKGLTLERAWTECLAMWRWVVAELDWEEAVGCPTSGVGELKREYMEKVLGVDYSHCKNRAEDNKILAADCFFCEYNDQQDGSSEDGEYTIEDDEGNEQVMGRCNRCPGVLADPNFFCQQGDYHYSNEPRLFLEMLERLDRIDLV